MKKTLLLFAALGFATAGAGFAQTTTTAAPNTKMKAKQDKPKKTPEQKADKGASKMARELGLNPDQEARVEQILLARQQEMQRLKAKYGQDRKAGQADVKAAKTRYNAQLKEVLTADQFAKYNQLKDEHKGPGKPEGQRPGKMKAKA
jgi:Spy/CpxP family protein refolding chaperone